MIGRVRQAWALWRFRRWTAEQDRRYRARRAQQRAVYLGWLADRQLPGTPKTVIGATAPVVEGVE